ncbi:ABC1 kinase family protein [Sphingomonas soli]|uniref:ABC1 kinase family protein n=1 Tax=Sphingomonas soli TaxID=266127 RepID=UPI00082FFCB7|nr:AarF/UbiB family protein [Sphingomonas soli]
MIKLLAATARDSARVSEITRVATRFGLGVLMAGLGFAPEEGAADVEGGPMPLPRRTRLAMETLGPSFVKIGQILATRSDLLGPEWIEELEQLHSDAPTLPYHVIRAAIEETLGQPPESAFASVDPEPLAAASMAQVHRATLHDGREVVLKVRRPGVRPAMEADLRLIAQLAALAERSSAEARRFEPMTMARELSRAMLEELDFTSEGRNAERIAEDFADEPRLMIPAIHWEVSTDALLVMDYIAGVKPTSGETLTSAGINPQAIAALGADVVLRMVLINGRFHGDPHPGNLLCLDGNRLALLDFGMIGHVSPRRRAEFIAFIQSIASGDPAGLADVLELWAQGHAVPRANVERAAEQVVQRHGGGALVLSAMIPDFMRLLREERLVMPPDLLLIFKAMVTIDGVLNRIAPGFDLSSAIRRARVRIVAERLSPARLAGTSAAIVRELAKLGEDAPRLIGALRRRIEAGPAPAPPSSEAGARWIAGAITLAGAMVALAVLIT